METRETMALGSRPSTHNPENELTAIKESFQYIGTAELIVQRP